MSAAEHDTGAGRRPRAAFLLLAALLAAAIAGVTIRPAGAVYRWEIGRTADGASTPVNAPAIAKAYHRYHKGFRSRFALTYRVERRSAWRPGPAIGCNDRWTVSARSLFGIEIARADIQCDGVEVGWGEAGAHGHR